MVTIVVIISNDPHRPLLPAKCLMSQFIHSVLRPLVWVGNVPCKRLVSAALLFGRIVFKPVQSLRSSTWLVSLFSVCLLLFLLLLSAEFHNVSVSYV